MVDIKTATATQDFVPIESIDDNVVILKDGALRAVLLTSSINIALKSYDEQQATLGAFRSFLNSIDFPIQIYIESRKLDIRPYLSYLASLEKTQYNDLMKTQLHEYIDFIRTFTEEVDIMKKNFFIVIPYSPAPIQSAGLGGIGALFNQQKGDEGKENVRLAEQKKQLDQRVFTIEQGLNHIGIKSARLSYNELVELYYHAFNPGELGTAPKIG